MKPFIQRKGKREGEKKDKRELGICSEFFSPGGPLL